MRTVTPPNVFMERVMAWPGPDGPGWVNLHWKKTFIGQDGKPHPAWFGSPFKTADQLVAYSQKLAVNKDKAEDIFYCLSVQSQADTKVSKRTGREFPIAVRDANNVVNLKAIWLDVDVKEEPKGYANVTAAKQALIDMCLTNNLPMPTAWVESGGGLHPYWISNKPLTKDEWRPYAEGLRDMAEKAGLRADLGVTIDSARILRMPGTFNRKTAVDRPVMCVKLLPTDYDFATDLKMLYDVGITKAVTAPVTKREVPTLDLTEFWNNTPTRVMHPALAADPIIRHQQETGQGTFGGLNAFNNLPLLVANVEQECEHFKDCRATHGQHHPQDLWSLTLLAASFFADGEKLAHDYSKGYPTYDPAETQAKYEEKLAYKAQKNLGWPACKSFENNGSKLCKTCKYYNSPTITSPMQLAERMKPEFEPPPAPIVLNPQMKAVMTAQDLYLPEGYTLINGAVSYAQASKDKAQPPSNVSIFEGEIISRPKIIREIPPRFFCKYQEGPNHMEVVFPYTAMKSDTTLLEALLDCGVHINLDAYTKVRPFMFSYTAKLDKAFKRLNSAPLGWIHEGDEDNKGKLIGFAYDGTVYKLDGTEEESGQATNEVTKHSGPCGVAAPCFEAHKMVCEANNPALEVLTLQSWASPLLEIAGLRSTSIVWAYSPSGGGKSTALQAGAAIWYAPVTLRERGGATTIGLENKMNTLRNLPCILDEMTAESETESVYPIFNRIHEGGQGSRGTKEGGNRKPKTWQLILACGANHSMYSFLTKKKTETDARAYRIFECIVEKRQGLRDQTEADQLIGSLEHNYGHYGVAYAKYLTVNFTQLQADYKAMAAQVGTDLGVPELGGAMPNAERFWKASVVLTLMAAKIANTVLGEELFHYDAIKKYLYDSHRRNRKWVHDKVVVAGTMTHTEEAWAKLLRMWINNQIVTDTMHAGNGRPAAVNVLSQPPVDRGYPVLMHWLKAPAMIRIAYTPLVDGLGELGLSLDVLEKLEKEFGGKKERKVFLAGIPVKEAKARMQVWEIPINPGHPLYDDWASKVGLTVEPASPVSAAMAAQDAPKTETFEEALSAGLAQAQKDGAHVRSV